MKKKILVLYTYVTKNYGSMMMCENLISYLNKKYNGNVDFYLDLRTIEDLKRIKTATKLKNVYIDDVIKYKNTKNLYINKINELFTSSFKYKKASKKYDAIIYLGGDVFSEVSMTKLEKIYNIFKINSMKYLTRNSKVILLGQTIGPYTGIRKKLVKRIFSKFTIYTRDDVNLNVMKENYNINPISSRDLAFLDLTLQSEYNKKYKSILKNYKLIENKYIVIVGTEFSRIYSSNESEFCESFIKIIKELQMKYSDKQLVWLSHVTSDYPFGSDNTLLDLLNNKYNNFINKNLTVIRKTILPVEARIILGHDYFTLTCRMHAAVSTYQMGRPAIALSYSPKYRGVIADGLNREDLVIEAKSTELWQGEIVNKVMGVTDFIDKNYDYIIEDSQKMVKKSQVIVNKTLDDIINLIGEDYE